MTHLISETVHQNNRRIWGSFKLSDKTTTKFEMKYEESWFQWNNMTDNLCITAPRVEELCNRWVEGDRT